MPTPRYELFTNLRFWGLALFGLVVAVSGVGIMLALRSSHEDDQPSLGTRSTSPAARTTEEPATANVE